MNEPRRGEVWLVDLGMAAKVRPCLVISIGATEQDRALATLVPHTTSARNSRFEVKLAVRFLREGVQQFISREGLQQACLRECRCANEQ